MKFLDKAKIRVVSGHGGNGMVAWRREKYVDKGIRIIRITNVQKGIIEDKEPQFYPIEKKTEIEEKIERERKAIKIPLIMGVVYVVIGATLLWYLKRYNLSLVNSQDVIIGTVMFLLQ